MLRTSLKGFVTGIPRRPAQRRRLLLAALGWLALIAAAVSGPGLVPGMLRVVCGFLALVVVPGGLTAALLHGQDHWSRIQLAALATVLGLAESLIIGQVVLFTGAGALALAVLIIGLSGVKLAVLARRERAPAVTRRKLDLAVVVQLAILLAVAVWVAVQVAKVPDHAQNSYSDFWSYTTVQAQMSSNPGVQVVFEDPVLTHGVNKRLAWNPWLYVMAMLNEFSGTHIVTFTDRDIHLPLHLLSVLAAIALARELFKDRVAAYSTGVVSALFLLVSADQFFDMRIVEDKFLSLMVLFPVVYMLVFRLIDRPTRRDWIAAGVVLVGVALVHPFNAPALAVTTVPFLALVTLRYWRTIDRRNVARVGLLVIALLIIPAVQEVVLNQSDYVASALDKGSRFDLGWHLDFPGIHTWIVTDTIYNAGFVAIFALVVLRAYRDKATLFLASVTGVIMLVIWVPPFSGIYASLVTRSQAWRIGFLIPVGYVWGWLYVQLREPLARYLSAPVTLALWGLVPYVVQLGLWAANPYPVRASLTYWAFDDPLWTALSAGEDIVGASRVLASPELSRYAPVFWPDAHYEFRLKPSPELDNQDILHLFGAAPAAQMPQVVERYRFDYLALERSFPVAQWVWSEWPCCEVVFQNASVTLAAVVYDIAPRAFDQPVVDVPLDVRLGEVAILKGYALQAVGAGTQITLVWEPLANSDAPLSVSVHLIGAFNPATDGPLWSQDDHAPRLGQVPTTGWAGEGLFSDPYLLNTGALPPGEYRVQVGLYDSATQQHVPVYDADGQLIGEWVTIDTWRIPG